MSLRPATASGRRGNDVHFLMGSVHVTWWPGVAGGMYYCAQSVKLDALAMPLVRRCGGSRTGRVVSDRRFNIQYVSVIFVCWHSAGTLSVYL